MEESETLFNDFEFPNPLDKIQSSGIKWISDATPQESFMALTESYSDQPGWYGVFNFPQDSFNQMIHDSYFNFKLKKKQMEIHAQGDAAIGNILNTMSSTGNDYMWNLKRLRIVHDDMIRPDQISDVAADPNRW